MEAEEWDEGVSGIAYVKPTKEHLSSKTASTAHSREQIQSTKIYIRNPIIYGMFVGGALYSLAVGCFSLLLGVLMGFIIFVMHISLAIYLLWISHSKFVFKSHGPLKFVPVTFLQATTYGIMHVWKRGNMLLFQKLVYGAPIVAYFIYTGVLLLRSNGVQSLKTAVPYYYKYLNLPEHTK